MSEHDEEIPVFDDSHAAKEKEEVSEQVRLPVGLEKDGVRYRNVVLDEMIGIDDHLVSGPKAGGNPGKGMSLVLCRCIQSIEGLVPQKKNPESLLDREVARRLTQVDRDFLITRIYLLSGNETGVLAGVCPRCKKPQECEVKLTDLTLVEWPEDKPTELDFTLKRGLHATGDSSDDASWHTEGVIRFPTGKEQELVAGMGEDGATATDAMLAACIKRIGGLGGIDQEQAKRLSSKDRRFLMQQLQRKLPGLRQWKEVTCSCRRKFDLVLDIAAFFEDRQG